MLTKQKMCAGWDGNSHLSFIYKNIEGKKYCKDCTYKINPPKPIKKMSERGKKVLEKKRTLTLAQWDFFLEIWEERPHYCEVTGAYLGEEPLSLFFDHLLEKARYPHLRFEKANIALVSPSVHSLKTGGHSLPKHQELIDIAKARFIQ